MPYDNGCWLCGEDFTPGQLIRYRTEWRARANAIHACCGNEHLDDRALNNYNEKETF